VNAGVIEAVFLQTPGGTVSTRTSAESRAGLCTIAWPSGFGEIEQRRSSCPVEGHEEVALAAAPGPRAPCVVVLSAAVGILDLDHLGAHVGQDLVHIGPAITREKSTTRIAMERRDDRMLPLAAR